MTIFDSIILGVVEGITEFLPISSTGHLILSARLLEITSSDFLKSFEIAIQLGAILSVIVLYGRSLLMNADVAKRIVAAFIPTGILGLVFYKIVKSFLLDNALVTLWALLIGGIAIILFERWHEKHHHREERDISDIPYWQCVLVGVFQSVAMIPGVSRAGATIIGGLALGISRKVIVEFSFLLAVPTMLAAAGLDIARTAGDFSVEQFTIIGVGFIAAFITAIFAIKFFLSFIQRHSFTSFGVYRIILAIVFLLLFV